MMSNVYIFARQLDYFLWSVVAVTFVLSGYYEESKPVTEFIEADATAERFPAEPVAG